MPRPMPKLDRAGRPQKEPHRLFHGIEDTIWLAERMPPRVVPPDYWNLDADPDDAESHVAVVACPCGASVVVPLLGALTRCEGEDCGRHFFFESVNVYCFRAIPESPPSAERTIVAP